MLNKGAVSCTFATQRGKSVCSTSQRYLEITYNARIGGRIAALSNMVRSFVRDLT